jgi:non-specific serine/threonine protein kinase
VPDIVCQLQQFRREHGLTQEQVARTLGVSVVTVSRWESHHSAPSARSARRIGQFIDHRRHPALPRAIRQLAPLPADPAPFTGRSRVLGRLLAIWPHQRLLTLTGPGGIGKTRLAVELLRRSGQLPLATVALDLVPDPALAQAEIAAVLGLSVPPGPRVETVIVSALQDTEGVLFLDGCEHVARALPRLLRALTSGARNLRVLATSRVPIEVPGERVWPVPGLDGPPAGVRLAGGAAASSDAVQYFLGRPLPYLPGRASDPAEQDRVGRLCRLLDGAPLALSLAAGRLGTLSLDEMIVYWEEHARLMDDPGSGYQRQQIIGSAIEWSAALLSQDDRNLLCDLSVFVGPFGLEDIEALSPEHSGSDLLAGVSRLVRFSWVTFSTDAGEQPYRMPGALRDWAHRELARTGRFGQVYRRHALYVRDLGRQAESNQFRIDRGNWPERLKRAFGHIQSVLHWACGAAPVLGAEIVTTLLGWWRSSGRIADGRHWLRACRESAGGLPALWEARVSCAEAVLAMDQGEYVAAERLAVSALPVLEAVGDSRWTSRALVVRSAAAGNRGQTGAARQYLSRAVDYQAGRGDLHEMAMALDSLARLEADAGHLRRATESYERSLTLRRELGDPRLTAIALGNLAEIATLGKSHVRARHLLDEAMKLADTVADDHVRAVITLGLAENLLGGKDYPAAIAHFRSARAHASAAGNGRLNTLAICGLGRALYADGHRTDGWNLLILAEKLAVQMDDYLALGRARDALKAVSGSEMGPKLTKRETEIIRLVDKGESDRAIADNLGIAVPTVRRHLENIFAKLDTRSRGSAAAIWRNLP